MKDLQQIQREIGEWSRKQFGNNISHMTGDPRYSQNALTGIVEEVGELNHVTICAHQGRRGYEQTREGREKYKADRDDALADILIFMCDYAEREGTDLLTLLNQTWDKVVSKRTVADLDQHTHETKKVTISESMLKADEEQTKLRGWPESQSVLHDYNPAIGNRKPCAKCGMPIHRTNSVGICSSCYGRQPSLTDADRKLLAEAQQRGEQRLAQQREQTGQGWSETKEQADA